MTRRPAMTHIAGWRQVGRKVHGEYIIWITITNKWISGRSQLQPPSAAAAPVDGLLRTDHSGPTAQSSPMESWHDGIAQPQMHAVACEDVGCVWVRRRPGGASPWISAGPTSDAPPWVTLGGRLNGEHLHGLCPQLQPGTVVRQLLQVKHRQYGCNRVSVALS